MRPTETEAIVVPGSDKAHRADDPHARAARWVAYLYSGHASEEGHRQFSMWLRRDPANLRAYRTLEESWRAIDHFAASELRPEPPSDTPSLLPAEPRARRVRADWPAPALAATFLAVMGVGLSSSVFTRSPAVETHYATRIGETRTFALTDGSTVVLGSGARLSARISRHRRTVRLTDGQAYFTIAHDASRPFIVDTGQVQVRDIGTEFDVLKGSDGVRVSVAHGMVSVRSAADVLGRGRELRAGQQVRATLDGRLGQVRPFDGLETLSWRTGRLVYANSSLADVVKDINRYRQTKIVLGEGMDPALRVTVTVPIGETDRFLRSLQVAERAKASFSGDQVVLTAR